MAGHPPAGRLVRPGDLADALRASADAQRIPGYVPVGQGLSRTLAAVAGPAIRAAGWQVGFRRTAAVRTIVFTRIDASPAAAPSAEVPPRRPTV